MPKDHPLRSNTLSLLAAWRIDITAMPQSEQREELLMNLSPAYEQWLEETLDQGRREGHREGLTLGLLRLLEKRFGPIDATIQQRIAASDEATLMVWFDRALDCQTLKAVFTPSNGHEAGDFDGDPEG
ncbi:MAG: hypothetical protein ACFCBW_00690 [Candidatus Competibacterales bacterium]